MKVDSEKMKKSISWRDRKIAMLEEESKIYAELVNMCLAIVGALVDCEKSAISKEKVSLALKDRYSVSEDEKYYYVERIRPDGKGM